MTFRDTVRDEVGSALLAGIIILFIVLGLGTALLSTANVASHQTGNEASGEAAFNLAEGALDAESNLLKQAWPSAATSACNQSSTPTSLCPGTSVTNSFSTTYAGNRFGNPQWSVQLADDSSPESSNYYTDSGTGVPAGVPNYDANNDNKVWVRAQATLGGQNRIVVAEMVRQTAVVALPRNMITAGGTYTSNNGNKIIIESTDPTTGLSGTIAVRCTPPTGGPTYQDSCTGWSPDKGQLDPASNFQGNYVGPSGGGSALSADTLQQLKQTAQAQGTYYNGVCPSNLNGLVYVDNPPGGSCSYTGGQWNGPYTSNCPSTWPSPCPASNAVPGAIIFGSGTLGFNGNINYYGIIYMVNAQGVPMPSGGCTSAQYSAENQPVFRVHGTTNVFGSVFVDGCGQVDAGDSKANINYAPRRRSAGSRRSRYRCWPRTRSGSCRTSDTKNAADAAATALVAVAGLAKFPSIVARDTSDHPSEGLLPWRPGRPIARRDPVVISEHRAVSPLLGELDPRAFRPSSIAGPSETSRPDPLRRARGRHGRGLEARQVGSDDQQRTAGTRGHPLPTVRPSDHPAGPMRDRFALNPSPGMESGPHLHASRQPPKAAPSNGFDFEPVTTMRACDESDARGVEAHRRSPGHCEQSHFRFANLARG